MPSKKKRKTGPEPERLKLDEKDWKEAVKKALPRKRPAKGWPGGEQTPPESEPE